MGKTDWVKLKGPTMDLPLEEISRLQEAVGPLGYAIHGFKDKLCADYGDIELYLCRTLNRCIIHKDPAVSIGVGEIGVAHNPDDSLQGAK